MRNIHALSVALVLLAACGGEPDPAPVPGPDPVAPVSPDVAARWVDDHVATHWFPAALEESEDRAEGMAGLGPAGEVPADSREPSDSPAPSPPVAPPEFASDAPFEGPGTNEPIPVDTGGAPAMRPPARAEVEEQNPRFGGVLDEPEPERDGLDAPGTWKRAKIQPNASKLEVGDDETLPLEHFEATVRVDGFRARVVLDLVYRNTFEEELEGLFKLRVPDEASVHFLAFGGVVEGAPLRVPVAADRAFDLAPAALMTARGGGGVLREARIVPRESAQRAYAAETAKRVDPALLQWAGAGVFSTSLAPLLPKQVHRVTVAYDMDLTATGSQRELVLDVPADTATSRVVIETAGRRGQHDGDATVSDGAKTELFEDRTVWTFDDPAESRITLRLGSQDALALVGDDAAIGPHFAAAVAPEIPASAAASHDRAVFLLDASMSSNPARMNVWLGLMSTVLERNRADVREFAVLFFNVETWWWREEMTPNSPESVEAFLRDARDLALEGATDVGAALASGTDPEWHRGALDADVFLLSDGAETWGATDAVGVAARVGVPVFCYTTGLPGTDVRTLRAVARESGGAVFSVVGEAEVAAAAVAHRSRPWSLRAVELAGCEDVLVAGRPDFVFPGQRLRIAGRGRPANGDEVVLTLEQDGRTHDVRMALFSVIPSSLAPRTYGEIATGQLEELAPLAGDEARAYATHYRVTGPTCSLLMLESEDAYREYGIVPAEVAAVVRERPVRAVTAELEAERGRRHGDPRTVFLDWLDRLKSASGVEFNELGEVRAAAEALPAESFAVQPTPLRCRTRGWADVTGAFQEQLVAVEPIYADVLSEALARRERVGSPDALRAFSSLVEADPASTDLLRDVAYSAMEWGLEGEAHGLLLRVVDARPHEPETYRALAECLERMGNTDLAVLTYEVAFRGLWDERFGAFPLIAAMDYGRLLRRIERGDAETRLGALAAAARAKIDKDYIDASPDLLITLTWNTDRTDIDLHVTDPAGEECFYQHPRTKIGGAMSADVTQGYGPEMFILGHAVPGEYLVRVHYYGSDSLRTTLRSRVYATVFRRWAREDEQITRHALLLADAKDFQEVVRLEWE